MLARILDPAAGTSDDSNNFRFYFALGEDGEVAPTIIPRSNGAARAAAAAREEFVKLTDAPGDYFGDLID